MAKRASTSSSTAGATPAPGALPGVALFHGPDAFLRRLWTDQLRALVEAAGVPVEVVRFDGATAQPAEVFDECRTMGLMRQHKLVILDDAEAFVKGDNRRALVERYAQSPAPDATLVLRSDTWRPGNLDKLIPRDWLKKCESPKPGEAVTWVRERCKAAHSATIEADAAGLLVERLGTDLGRLDSELEKLAASTGGKPVTAQEVRELVGLAREEKAWEIQAALLAGDTEAALVKLHELLEVSRVDAVPLRWAVADLARKLHAASRMLRAGANPRQLFSELKLWGDAGNAVVSIAKRVDPERLADLFKAALEADARAKRSDGDEVLALELLTLRFAAAAR